MIGRGLKKLSEFLQCVLALCIFLFPCVAEAGPSVRPAPPQPVTEEAWFAAFDAQTSETVAWRTEDIGADVGWTRYVAELCGGKVVLIAHADEQTKTMTQFLLRPGEGQAPEKIQDEMRSAGGQLMRALLSEQEEAEAALASLLTEATSGEARKAVGQWEDFGVSVEADPAGNLTSILYEYARAGM